jgi:hypothetical protein
VSRRVVWFSCGAPSAVAAKLVLSEHDDAILGYCETGAEHDDNERFIRDCEAWLGHKVTRLKSTQYKDTWDVWEKKRYIAGISGAPCTGALKVQPRLDFQQPDDIHVFGYTADGTDVTRAEALRENYPELTIETPLIARGLKKDACLSLIEGAGIEIPTAYKLGFPNNNCIPCGKATSAAYWALVRKHFPSEFERMATLSRELGARLCRIDGERAFIDEIPADYPVTQPVMPACDFLCALAGQDIA